MKLTTEQQNFITAVCDSNPQGVLLLGKAGVGKSVCIEAAIEAAQAAKKRFFVLAPTGIAALNVGGETIHRFIKRMQYDTNGRLMKPHFIIIDEISMCRADLLDELDRELTAHFGSTDDLFGVSRFGGIKMILCGDVAQLPPVIKPDEAQELKAAGYDTSWFFSAKSYKTTQWRRMVLTTVFRQRDAQFTDLLNNIRVGVGVDEALNYLNSERVAAAPRGVILTATNKGAERINATYLARITTEPQTYEAIIEDDFYPNEYPNDQLVQLKAGARALCVKNIYRGEGEDRELIVTNGDTGIVLEVEETGAKFLCDRTKEEVWITIDDGIWRKIKREVGQEGTIEREVGKFTQIPLKLCYAMTIHKAQGQTIEELTIDARSRFFAHGQAYVALSRGVSLDKIWIMGKLQSRDIIVDSDVVNFLNSDGELW